MPVTSLEPMSISVQLNGVPRTLPAPTIDAALDLLALPRDARHVAVAVNEAVVPRTRWADVMLDADDRVEIITAVAGG